MYVRPLFLEGLCHPRQQTGSSQKLSPLENRALDKRGPLMIIEGKLFFPLKPYVMTPHLNRLNETVQMRGHNICFHSELTKIYPNYQQIVPQIY